MHPPGPVRIRHAVALKLAIALGCGEPRVEVGEVGEDGDAGSEPALSETGSSTGSSDGRAPLFGGVEKGPFLLGAFSIADCMYFPVASRFRTYGVRLPDFAQAYSAALFALPEAQELEELAKAAPAIPEYDSSLG